ncbi:hypothetical protein K2X30_14935 [bacterium]|nr:hypothetical protein [bacterium]
MSLRKLDQFLGNRGDLTRVRKFLEKIEKCCGALEQKNNLGDILADPSNYKALLAGVEDELEYAIPMAARLCHEGYTVKSFLVETAITGAKRFDFIYRAVAGWSQFDGCVVFQFEVGEERAPAVINTKRIQHWNQLQNIPAGTLVTIYLKTVQGKRSASQENLAVERFQAVFEVVQSPNGDLSTPVASVLQFNPQAGEKTESKPNKSGPKQQKSAFARTTSLQNFTAIPSGQAPSMSFRVVINKIDTVVHAGNAHLILSHIREYTGKVALYVLRDKKQNVRMDADSIWGADIRNGETVLFEFFGPNPSDDFVKELARKVNKYTQMDKLGTE